MPAFRILSLLLVSTLLVAQEDARRPRERRPDPAFLAQIQKQHAERLKQHLGISDEKATAIAARWGRWIRESMDRGRQSMLIRRQFDEILRGPGTDEEKSGRLKPLLDQFLAIRQQQLDLKKAFEDDVRVGLNPAQQTRLILMVEELQRKLHEGVREAEERGRMGNRWRRE